MLTKKNKNDRKIPHDKISYTKNGHTWKKNNSVQSNLKKKSFPYWKNFPFHRTRSLKNYGFNEFPYRAESIMIATIAMIRIAGVTGPNSGTA